MNGYDATQTEYGQWMGARVLVIDALPQMIPQQAQISVLSACAAAAISPELCIMSAPNSMGRLQAALILRAQGGNREALMRRLDAFAENLSAQLRGWGFGYCRDDSVGAQINAAAGPSMLYFPSEPIHGDYYTPGCCADLPPLRLSEIADVLFRFPDAMFCVQLSCTQLLPNEKAEMDRYRRFLQDRAQKGDRAAGECANVYEAWMQYADLPLFFQSILLRGNGNARQAMAGLMLRSAMHGAEIAPWLLSGKNYLTQGAQCVADFAARNAHTARPWFALQRLNHLATPIQIRNFLAIEGRTERILGFSIQHIAMDRMPLPNSMLGAEGLSLGKHFETDAALTLPMRQMPKHGVIMGMPGSGKTSFAFQTLSDMAKKGVPFVAVEPTKCEYRTLIDVIPDLRVLTPGNSDASPVALNPFLPPKGVTLERYLPALITVFTAAFSMPHPLDVIFPDTVRACYTRYGWRMDSTRDSKNVKIFGLSEFVCMFRESVRRLGYDAESQSNIEGAGVARLQSLLNLNPVLFDTDRTMPFDEMLKGHTVIELDAIDNTAQKSLIMMLILVNLMLVIRSTQPCDGVLKNLIFIDEAHLLLGRPRVNVNQEDADPAGQAAQLLQDMTVQIRAYGTALLFADQSPEKLTQEIVGNANLKIMFRLDSARDRMLLAENIGMRDEVAAAIGVLPVGEAYVHCSDLDRPVHAVFPNTKKALGLRAAVSDAEIHSAMSACVQRPFGACEACAACQNGCDMKCRAEADFLARCFCDRFASLMNDRAALTALMKNELDAAVRLMIEEHCADWPNPERLAECARMMIVRKVLQMNRCGLSETEIG